MQSPADHRRQLAKSVGAASRFDTTAIEVGCVGHPAGHAATWGRPLGRRPKIINANKPIKCGPLSCALSLTYSISFSLSLWRGCPLRTRIENHLNHLWNAAITKRLYLYRHYSVVLCSAVRERDKLSSWRKNCGKLNKTCKCLHCNE